MLCGLYTYKGHSYDLKGYDFGGNAEFRFYPVLHEDKKFLDEGFLYENGDFDPAGWESLWVSVGSGNVRCDCYIESDSGKKIKNAVNKELLVAFGQVFEGMKAGCTSLNMKDDDSLYKGKFNPRSSFTYVYDRGEITTKMGIVEKLKYDDVEKGISLVLDDDMGYGVQIFADNKSPYKFKLDLSEFVKYGTDDSDWDFGDSTKVYTLSEIIERNPHKSYLWLKERNYHIINDIKEFEKLCKYLWQFKLVSFDTETTGLTINITSRRGQGDRLVGLVFAVKPGTAYYIPIAHKKVKNICTPGEEHAFMEKYVKPILEEKDILCHNGSYDWKVMHNYDICMNLVHDTFILLKVTLGNLYPDMPLGLKSVTKRFLDRDSFELSDFVEGKFDSKNVKFWDLDEESVKYYACPDADNTLELFQWLMNNRLLDEYEATKVYEMEVQFSVVIAYQEYYGHHVAVDRIDDLVKDIKTSKEENYKKMVEILGHDFNPKSSKDLPKAMFEELGMPVLAKTETGNPSTDKTVRAQLLEEENPDGSLKYPFVKYLSGYMDACTLESTFTKNISKFATEDGLMFSEVTQFLKTGRVSVKNPNYQGYSGVVKKYISPRDGYYALDADYSSVEARIMCSWAGCKDMIEKLKNSDTDYHRQKAADMNNIPYELVTSELRQISKGVNFGLLYGMGDKKLGKRLRGEVSVANTKYAAKQRELYFRGMDELKPFIEKSREMGIQKGYSTTFYGRRRYYNKAKTRTDSIERQSCNARIQGTAADVYKYGMIRLFKEIVRRNWVGRFLICAFVHDECYCEVSKSINPFLALKVVREAMMLNIEGWTTLFTGEGVGDTWYEAKKTEIPVQVQESLTETYADNCPEWWKGDTKELSRFVVNTIQNYQRDRVLNYLKDESNWGKVFKPTENELSHEILSSIKKGADVEGLVCRDVEPKTDMLDNLKQFCIAFGVEDLYDKADIRRPEVVNNKPAEEDDEDESFEEVSARDIMLGKVEQLGVDIEGYGAERKLYFKYDDTRPMLMAQMKRTMEKYPGDIEVIAVKNGEEYSVGMSVAQKAYTVLLGVYLSYINIERANRG